MDDIFSSDAKDTPDSEITAHQRLRAFEDQHLGKDAARINGVIEKGHGSPFKALSPDHHREYAALERLHGAEKLLSDAAGTLAQAQSAYDTAKAQADAAAVEVKGDDGPDGPTVSEYVAAGYLARNYPPYGYASKSTDAEIETAIAAQEKPKQED